MSSNITRSVVLVGMMGAGKTTIGRKLAKLLDVDFVDLDSYIERKVCLPVADIFELLGEPYFREQEEIAIKHLISSETRVIALGGGAFASDINRQLINSSAISVWLDADIDTLVERVSRTDRRPLLRGKDKRETLQALLEKRHSAYAQAHLRINTSGMILADIASLIADKITGG